MHLLLPFSLLLLGASLSSSVPTQVREDEDEELKHLREELEDLKKYVKNVEAKFLSVHNGRSFATGSQSIYVTNEKEGDFETVFDMCVQAGGYIPYPEKGGENHALQNVLKRHNKSAYVLDSNAAGYSNWAPGEPNNSDGTKNCIEIDKDGKWQAASCSQTHLAVCEFSFLKPRPSQPQKSQK